MNNINDKKNRKSVATGTYSVREIKEKVLVNGVPYTYKEFLNLDHYEGEYVFPFIDRTIHMVEMSEGLYQLAGIEKNYHTNSLVRALMVCLICQRARNKGLKKFTLSLVSGKKRFSYLDNGLNFPFKEMSKLFWKTAFANENLNRDVSAELEEAVA